MKSFPICWNKTLAQLGFRRKKRKLSSKWQYGRRPLFESLEQRQMLTVSGPVNTLLDVVNASDGVYSLREAIIDANANVDADVIQFAEGLTGTIVLGGTRLPDITKALTIQGPGADVLNISGNDTNRVFLISSGADVTLSGLTISDGEAEDRNDCGGGIFSEGNLTLESMKIVDNNAAAGGGGLYSDAGSVTIIDTTFDGNTATNAGGARISVDSSSTVHISGSTFSNNKATNATGGSTGGLWLAGASTTPMEVVNSTFSGNEAYSAGGIRVRAGATAKIINTTITDNEGLTHAGGLQISDIAVAELHNTILAGNTAPATANLAGTLHSSSSHNLVNTANLGLAPLGFYGGATKTHALLPTSPAINAGGNAKAAEYDIVQDQRGFERFPITGLEEEIVDIGAVEAVDSLFVVDTVTDENDGDYSPGDRSLREALALAAAISGVQEIRFSPNLATTLTLTLGELILDSDVDIVGLGYNKFTIYANEQSRVFKVESGVTAKLKDLAITGGRVTSSSTGGNAGGGIYNEGNLTLDTVVVSDSATDFADNGALNHGGGIYSVDGSLTLIDTTVDDNRARDGGGIAAEFDGGTLEISRSTISRNTALDDTDVGTGGGLLVSGTTGSSLTITNSTFSGNESSEGGGIRVEGADTELTIINATITDNHADVTGGFAGGVHNADEATITMHNTILAANTAADATSVDVWGSVGGASGNLSSYNILGVQHSTILSATTPHSGLSNGTNGNQVGNESTPIDPKLAPLEDYSGPTKTHSLLFESPALDKGTDTYTELLGHYDQRKHLRPFELPGIGNDVTGITDIGAYESGNAATLEVTILEDIVDSEDNEFSLRERLEYAATTPEVEHIVFAPGLFVDGPQTLVLNGTYGALSITGDTEIIGPGADLLTIDANGASNVFSASPWYTQEPATPQEWHGINNTIYLSGLTLAGASNAAVSISVVSIDDAELVGLVIEGNGSGVFHYSGQLTVTDSEIRNNSGEGILFADGKLIIESSTIAENQGSAVRSSYAITEITNTTISGNQVNDGTSVVDTYFVAATLTNVTITDNIAFTEYPGTVSGGIYAGSYSDVVLQNSIVAGNYVRNSAGNISVSDLGQAGGTFSSMSTNNIIGYDNTDTFPTNNNNQVGFNFSAPLDPHIGPLKYNGGPTRTHALLSNSPAIDAGSNTAATNAGLTTDQRGYTRIINYDGTGTNNVDIGAFEHGLVVSTLQDESDGNYAVGDLSLREALSLAGQAGQNVVNVKDEITFAPGLIGGEIVLGSLGELIINSDVDIVGPGSGQLTINANASSTSVRRVFFVTGTTTDATIKGLTVTGGYTTGHGAGIWNNAANLTLREIAVVDNQTSGSGTGGGIYSSNGSLRIYDSEIANNTSSANSGGGIRFTSDGDETFEISGTAIHHNKALNGPGGGLHVSKSTVGGAPVDLTITETTISDNYAKNGGGGIHLTHTSTSTVGVDATLIDSTIANNEANTGRGGGIDSSVGKLALENVNVIGNVAATSGGGIYSGGDFTIHNSDIRSNVARYGGGVSAAVVGKTFRMTDSVVSDNRAESTADTYGGGIVVDGGAAISGTVTILGSTISHNLSRGLSGDTAGTQNSRAGLYIYQVASGSITNTTVSHNVADDENGGISVNRSGSASSNIAITNSTIAYNTGETYGGIDVRFSSASLRNTIIAQNIGGDIGTITAVPTVQNSLIGVKPPSIAINDNGGNLIGTAASPKDPMLAPLASYGGPTETHALLPGSPAIDKGNNSLIVEPKDQRGFDRTVDGPDNGSLAGDTIDIGAFEVSKPIVPKADFDGDGFSDSAYLDPETRTLYVITGNRSAAPGNWATLPTGNWTKFHAGDFNGDGRDDIAAYDSVTMQWTYAISESTLFNLHSLGDVSTTNWYISSVGDFDGDGSDELIGKAASQNNTNAWFVLQYDERSGVKLENWGASITGLTPWTIFVGDVNRDGKDDLIARGNPGSSWVYSLSQGTSFTQGWGLGTTWFNAYHPSGTLDQGFHPKFSRDPNSVDADGPIQKIIDEFSSVYNNVELELYRGFMKGIQPAEETKAANPFDQAALLVDRLDGKGLTSDIVVGKIEADWQVVRDWIGAPDSMLNPSNKQQSVLDIIKAAFDPSATINGSKIRFDHAWVRIQVPTVTGLGYIDLDPSWKFKDRQLGILPSSLNSLLVGFNVTDYLSEIRDERALEYYEDQLNNYLRANHPGISLSEVAYDGPIHTQLFTEVPGAFTTSDVSIYGTTSIYADLAALVGNSTARDAWTHRVHVELLKGTSSLTSILSLSNSIIVPTAAYDQIAVTYSGNTPQLVIGGGSPTSASSTVLSSDVLTVRLSYYDPGETAVSSGVRKTDWRIRNQQYVSFGLNAGQHSAQSLALDRQNLLAGSIAAKDVLTLIAKDYWFQVETSTKAAAGLMGAAHIRRSVDAVAVMSDSSIANTNDDAPYGVILNHAGLSIDMDGNGIHHWHSGKEGDLSGRILFYEVSGLEHEILEKAFGTESISSVKGLQRAYQRAYGVNQSDTAVSDDEILDIRITEQTSGYKLSIVPMSTNSSGYTIQSASTIEGLRTGLETALARHGATGQNWIADYIINKVSESGVWLDAVDPFPVQGVSSPVARTSFRVAKSPSKLETWIGGVFQAEIYKNDGDEVNFVIGIREKNGELMSGGASGGVAIPSSELAPAGRGSFQPMDKGSVNLANGSLTRTDIDLLFPNFGVSLDFKRYYSSQSEFDIDELAADVAVGFGKGWTHSFSDRLLYAGGNSSHPDLVWVSSTGSRHAFIWDAANTKYLVPAELTGEFKEVSSGYQYLERDGMEYHFATGTWSLTTNGAFYARLSQKIDLNGDGVELVYGDSSKPRNVTRVRDAKHATTRYLDFGYNTAKDRITSIQRYDSVIKGTWTYTYDGNNQLWKALSATDTLLAAPFVVEYNYNSTGLLSKTIEPNGDYRKYDYYRSGRVSRIHQSVDLKAAGDTDDILTTRAYDYNLVTRTTTVVDERGNIETYRYQDNGLLIRQIHDDRSRIDTTWGVEVGGTSVAGTDYLMTSRTDEVGAIESFEYYSSAITDGNKFKQLKKTIGNHFAGQLGLETTYDYFIPTGSTKTHMAVVNHIHVDPSGTDAWTEHVYDSTTGKLARTIVHNSTRKADGTTYTDSITRYGYNSNDHDRLYTITTPNGTDEDARLLRYKVIGNFEVTSGTLNIEVSADAGTGILVADAIRIDRIGEAGSSTYTYDRLETIFADNANPVGTGWTNNTADLGAFNNNVWQNSSPTTAGVKATWQITGLTPGVYSIYATLPEFTGRWTAARYRVFDGSTERTIPNDTLVRNQNASDHTNFTTVLLRDHAGNVTNSRMAGIAPTTALYDSSGMPTQVVDPTGRKTTSQYDVLGRLRSVSNQGSSTQQPLTTAYEYDAAGQLTKVIDALGRTTTNEYDRRGLLLKTTYSDGTSMSYSYDNVGNLVSQTDALGRTTRFQYDGRNRLVQTIHPDGATGILRYDGTGRVAEATDALGNRTTFTYDAAGRLVTQVNAAGAINATTTNKYDVRGNVIETIDPDGRTTQYVYDKLNRIVVTRVLDSTEISNVSTYRAQSPKAILSGKPVFLSSNKYDKNGNLIQVIVYDMNSLTSVPLNFATLEVDLATLVTTQNQTDNKIQVTDFVYDSFSRLVETIYRKGGNNELGQAEDVSKKQVFDGAGRARLGYDELGRPAELRYDTYGRLVETHLTDPNNKQINIGSPITRYEYDAVGNLVAVIDANGNRTTNVYDALNRLIASSNAEHESKQLIYDKAGQVIASIDALQRAVYTKRDGRGRVILERLPDQNPIQSQLSHAAETKYEYDDFGNLTKLTDARGFTTEFDYDELNRLTHEYTPVTHLADNSNYGTKNDPQFSVISGTPTYQASNSAAFGNDVTEIVGGQAQWTFTDLAPGKYRVLITWDYGATGLANNASASINGGTAITVDQSTPPFDEMRELEGRWRGWKVLDSDVSPNGSGTLTVTLAALGKLHADIVMLERVRGTDPVDATTTYTYDGNGNLKSLKNSLGRIVSYDYDELNRVEKITLPDPAGTLQAPVIKYEYDGYSNLLKMEEERGGDPSRFIEYVYDQRNRIKVERLAVGTADQIESRYTYDKVGNLTDFVEAYGVTGQQRSVHFDYDHLNRVYEEFHYATGDSSNWLTFTRYSDYDKLGNPLRVLDASQIPGQSSSATITEYAYDRANRLVIEVSAEGSSLEATTKYGYDKIGNVVSVTDPTGRITTYEYDRLSQLTKMTESDPDGPGDLEAPSMTYAYDLAGNVITQANAANEIDSFVYDSFGRTILAVRPDKTETRYTYDSESNLLSVLDAEYNETAYEYDELNRIKKMTDQFNKSVIYTYDDSQNLQQIEDRNGRVSKFTYDDLDRLKTEKWFDNTSDLTANATLSWDYDKLGRVLSSKVLDQALSTIYVETFEYDIFDRVLVQRNYDKNVATAANPKAKLEYTYDLASGLAPTEFTKTEVKQSVGTASTADTSLTHKATTTYTADKLGRLSAVDDAPNGANGIDTKAVDFTYDKAGRLVTINRLQGSYSLNTLYQYDGTGRVTDIDHDRGGSTSIFSTFDYTYDVASRTTKESSWTQFSFLKLTRDQTFTYDSEGSGQLTGYTSQIIDRNTSISPDLSQALTTTNFGYDDNGNRTSTNSATHTFTGNNRLEDDSVYTYAYDFEGNLTRKTLKTDATGNTYTEYTWDHRNRLIALKEYTAGTLTTDVEYRYNNSDLLVRKKVNVSAGITGTEHYVYDGNEVAMVLDNDGDLQHRYLHGPGTDFLLADEVFSSTGAQQRTLWAFLDDLGSIHDYLDGDNTNSVYHFEYDAFGNILRAVDPNKANISASALDNLFTFAGRTWDQEAGLFYNRARWYDPVSARFLSEDPLGFGGGDANLYRYAGNDPINFSDPSGLSWLSKAAKKVKNAVKDVYEDVEDFVDDDLDQLGHNIDDYVNEHGGWGTWIAASVAIGLGVYYVVGSGLLPTVGFGSVADGIGVTLTWPGTSSNIVSSIAATASSKLSEGLVFQSIAHFSTPATAAFTATASAAAATGAAAGLTAAVAGGLIRGSRDTTTSESAGPPGPVGGNPGSGSGVTTPPPSTGTPSGDPPSSGPPSSGPPTPRTSLSDEEIRAFGMSLPPGYFKNIPEYIEVGNTPGSMISTGVQFVWDSIKLWDNKTVLTDYQNLRNSGYGVAGAAYVAGMTAIGSLAGVTDIYDAFDTKNNMTYGERALSAASGTVKLVSTATGLKALANLGWSFFFKQSTPKPSLDAHKKALKEVHEQVGKLPKGEPGKFGSPQAGTPKKGYRLDPPHDRPAGDPEGFHHFNWWDYTDGKRGDGGRSGVVPILE